MSLTAFSPVRFSRLQVEAFLNFSGDRSPLHCDDDYVRRTPFGQIVVPGMCAALTALSHWPERHDATIHRIQGSFKKPLFLDEDYRLEIEDGAGQLTARFYKGLSLSTEIIVSSSRGSGDIRSRSSWEPTFRRTDAHYSPEMAVHAALRREFDLPAPGVPVAPVSALAWASYFIGMEHPGTHALFSSFDIAFDPAYVERPTFDFPEIVARFDDRFRRTTVEGRSSGGITQFVLNAFVRPEPVEYSLADVQRAFDGQRSAFKDKHIFVSGGDRGFGGVLTRAFLVCGSHVIFTYHKGAIDAGHIEAEAAALNTQARAFQADLTSPDDCARIAAQTAEAFGTLDLVVHNAALPIRPQAFLDQDPAEFSGVVDRSIRMMSQVCYELLPLMNPGGTIVSISSAYVRQPRELFSHYICSKAAIEGLTRALAEEFKSVQFVIARPPRMATDQTNAPFSIEPVVSAVPIARRLVAHLEELSMAGQNIHEIDL